MPGDKQTTGDSRDEVISLHFEKYGYSVVEVSFLVEKSFFAFPAEIMIDEGTGTSGSSACPYDDKTAENEKYCSKIKASNPVIVNGESGLNWLKEQSALEKLLFAPFNPAGVTKEFSDKELSSAEPVDIIAVYLFREPTLKDRQDINALLSEGSSVSREFQYLKNSMQRWEAKGEIPGIAIPKLLTHPLLDIQP